MLNTKQLIAVSLLSLAACTKEQPKELSINSVQSSARTVVPLFRETDLCVKLARDLDFQAFRLASKRITDAVSKPDVDLSELQLGKFLNMVQVSTILKKIGFASYQEYLQWQFSTDVSIAKVKSKFGINIDPVVFSNALLLTTADYTNPQVCVYNYQKCNIGANDAYDKAIFSCGAAAFGTMFANPLLGLGVYVVCGGFAMHSHNTGYKMCNLDYKICMTNKQLDIAIPPIFKLIFVRNDLIFRHI